MPPKLEEPPQPQCYGMRQDGKAVLPVAFATHLLDSNVPIYTVQALLGHARIETTMIYNHVANPIAQRVKSPLDGLPDQ